MEEKSYECKIPDEEYSINFFRKMRWAAIVLS